MNTRLKYLLVLLLGLAAGVNGAWADSSVAFSFASKWGSNSQTLAPITVTFGGSTSDQTGFRRFKKSATMSVSAETGYNITGIAVTFSNKEKTYPIDGNIAASSGNLSFSGATCTWSGTATNAVVLTKDNTGVEYDIVDISVTYTNATQTEWAYSIPIEDLRFEHLTYNPGRTGILGLNISTSGWQSETLGGVYSILKSNNNAEATVTVASSTANITKVVLVGEAGVFSNTTITSSDTYPTTESDQIVWQSSTPASSVTITINSSDRPKFQYIYVFTNSALPETKKDIALVFSPASNSETVNTGITDYSIDGKLVISGENQTFRPDSYSVAENSLGVSYAGFHLTSGKVGVNTGSTAGTTNVNASFTDNAFYHVTSIGSYALTTTASTTTGTKTITIDDMRFAKKNRSTGLDASDGLNRDLGGFTFTFSGGQGIKYNNGDGILLRYVDASNIGSITIAPKNSSNSGTITINRVDIATYPSTTFTDGTVRVSGLKDNQTISNVSSFSFPNSGDSFTMTAVSGMVYIQSFTIYYTVSDGATLDDALVTPTITWSMTEDNNVNASSYTSPTITTGPTNFDINFASSNTSVATVKSDDRLTAPLVELQGATGTANITASAASSTYYNAANAIYTINVTSTPNSKLWDFTTVTSSDFGSSQWSQSGDVYQNKFTAAQNEYFTYSEGSAFSGLRFGRANSSGLVEKQIRWSASNYLFFNNSAVIVSVPVTAGQNVIVTYDTYNSSAGGFTFSNAKFEDGTSGTETNTTDGSIQTVTLTATADGWVDLKVNSSKVRLYSIVVRSETRGTLGMRDSGSNSYVKYVGSGNNDNHFSHRVTYSPSDGATTPVTYAADAAHFHITSSDANVLDVSNVYIPENSFGTSSSFYFANVIPKGAGTATLTVTFDGNDDYKNNIYTSKTYTVYGPIASYNVVAHDQQIQEGQLSHFSPVITDSQGRLLGIRETSEGSGSYTTYIIDTEEEGTPDYTTWFDFAYAVGTGSGTNYEKITVDNLGAISTEDNEGMAVAGATRNVTITATPKSEYASAFANGTSQTATTTSTITIIEKIKEVQLRFYWKASDAAVANNDTISTKEYHTDDTKLRIFGNGVTTEITNFNNGFPNGRMLYAVPKIEGDSIWFSYATNADAATIPANPTLDKNKHIYAYRRGVPIHIDDNLSSGDYVSLNIVATRWDASLKKRVLSGSVVRFKFIMVAHDRPDQPTYDPISPDADATLNKDGRKIMNTSENVVAYGEGASKTTVGNGNLVYGKFSTSSVYTTAQLINENAVQLGINSVPVVSTEVAKRRFTAVQIKTVSSDGDYGYGEYISEQTYTEYWYLFDTDLRLYSDAAKTTPLGSRLDINVSGTSTVPYYKVTWYNKRNYDDPGNYNLGITQEVNSYAGMISYEIASRSGASDATINSSTGAVTAGSETGWVRVKATYLGGEEHGGKSGEPQYKSTTDESEAYFYVYISDPSKELPVITPASKNFAGTMQYMVTAPATWDVIYTFGKVDDNLPADPVIPSSGDPSISHNNSTNWIEIGSDMTIGDSYMVKAIAYNPSDRTKYSSIVYETYTKKDAIPDPIFDPNGVGIAYRYNTSTLTVQIACARAGAVIYYTRSDETNDNPIIGAAKTYKYSGLSKVIISGNVTIKAIAYDPVEDMYSNVVASSYVYSDVMDKPYFQISNDEGLTWLGLATEGASSLTVGGTKWYSGESFGVTPQTQIRIVDPNPVKGTIYYTLDGETTPSNDASSFVYTEGYPFTVAKPSTTGQAITILDDAKSDVSSAVFTMASGFNVWEAVAETLDADEVDGKHVMTYNNGFVISTDKDLKVSHTGSDVNYRSIASESGGSASKMYAQAHITATFGGFDNLLSEDIPWQEMTIADAAIGSPIDAVGTYSIKNDKNNAKTEDNNNYNHVFSYKKGKTDSEADIVAAATHEKTFKLPSQGAFVRFEPEKDGDLTIWVLQQGALLYEDDKYFVENVVRMRPVYLVDEQGKSYPVKTINGVPQLWSAARLSENWAKIQAVAATNGWKNSKNNNGEMSTDDAYAIYIHLADGKTQTTAPTVSDSKYIVEKITDEIKELESSNAAEYAKYYKKIYNKGPNTVETAAIYQLYKANLDKNHVGIGDPIKPFAIHTGSMISLNDSQYKDDSNDQTGYVLASGGYAKYTFEVKAGKTYYFFAQGSKIGVRGFQFVPTESGARSPVTINPETTSSISVEDAPVNVTVNRTFKAGTWTSLVLPFSVSATQLEKVFGSGTEVLHFEKVGQTGVHWRLYLMKHYYQMIVAGTPVLVKPANEVTNPTFQGVHIETESVASMTEGEYTMMGTLVKQENASEGLKSGDYFMANTGSFMRWTGSDTAMRGTYAWLHPTTAEAAARELTFSYEDVIDGTTGIISLERSAFVPEEMADGAVYDLRGVKVSDGSLQHLRKGVYIVNGKKMIVD